MSSTTSVSSWYSGKTIFMTGSSGFLGVCLLEKLLRCVPDSGNIYLLLRPKRGKDIDQRLEELKKNSVFETLLESKSVEEVFARVKVVSGDVGEPNLGLSETDRKLLTENVNVIFHSAATLDFAEGLKQTIEINLLGTRKVLELAAQCQKLDAFVHVSSAYVNSWRLNAEEIFYPLPCEPDKIISLVEETSESELEKITPELLGEHPNTYTYTKHMAEYEVRKMEERFPCTIVRPSMIVGAWKEPCPGWTVSKNGPQGFLMGAAKGIIRRLPVGKNLIYDYIPVDIVVNQLIVAGYHAGYTHTKTVEIYHCTSSTRRPFRWISVDDKINSYLHKFPLKSAIWYPHLKLLPSITWFKISAIFVHVLPALVLDTVTRITGGKPILMKLHRNVNSSLDRLERFIFTEWTFSTDKTDKLQKSLLPQDQITFNLDILALSWPEYFDDLAKGVRRYLNREKMNNIEAARGKDSLLLVLHLLLQGGIFSLVWYSFACMFGMTMSKSAFVVPLTYILFSFL